MTDLVLHLKTCYFRQIKDGSKRFEYRLDNDYWRKRLVHREYDRVIFWDAYKKRRDETVIVRPYRGYRMEMISHPHFGPNRVTVFAIHAQIDGADTEERVMEIPKLQTYEPVSGMYPVSSGNGTYVRRSDIEQSMAALKARVKELEAQVSILTEKDTALTAKNEQLKAPVSDGAWRKHATHWSDVDAEEWDVELIYREDFNAILAARDAQPEGDGSAGRIDYNQPAPTYLRIDRTDEWEKRQDAQPAPPRCICGYDARNNERDFNPDCAVHAKEKP